MSHAKDILAGIAVFLIIAGTLGGLIAWGAISSASNREKVEKMTTFCINHGYRGWTDNSGSQQAGQSVCTN